MRKFNCNCYSTDVLVTSVLNRALVYLVIPAYICQSTKILSKREKLIFHFNFRYLTYTYSIALPIWWANGQSVMICFFGFLAIQAKLRAPNAHTLLELIKVRYGTIAHILWIFLCLLNNLFNFTSMIVGASTAVSSLTGVDIIAATYLLPLGVVVYTYFGGIRATFLTDYTHAFIIMIILV